MFVEKVHNWVLFRTSFNEKFDIIHQFQNLEGAPLTHNNNVDFYKSQLIEKDKEKSWDWDVETIPLSQSTDEMPTFTINDEYYGGGHGYPCCIIVYSPLHGKTLSDVGALYSDTEGTLFTLLRVINEDYLLFVSKNLGDNVFDFEFKNHITQKLIYLSDGKDTSDILIVSQTSRHFLSGSARLLNRKIVCYKDGKSRSIIHSAHCDYAEIIEEFELINPATVAPALNAERPDGGYKHTPDLSLIGKPMFRVKYVYHVNPDGTIVVRFDVDKLMDVDFSRFLGCLFQKRNNVFNGGLFRYIPKIKPFWTLEGTFDFSTPHPLQNAPYPDNHHPRSEFFTDKNFPPDRIIDYMRDESGADRLGFACGYLPVLDGRPKIRKNKLNGAIHLYSSKNGMPVFLTGKLSNIKGVYYKKYFDTANRASVYSVEYKNKNYIYFDIFEKKTLTYDVKGKISLFESDGLNYEINGSTLSVSGDKGYAVFIEE